MSTNSPHQSERVGSYRELVEESLNFAERVQMMRRIWEKDAGLWKDDEAHRKVIGNALGWLNVARWSAQQLDEVEAFTSEVRRAGFKHVVLLGMGGSSLCPEVLRRTFGSADGYLELLVLDSTDPDTVADFDRRADPASSLYIVASKSGSTVEPISFFKYFFDRVRSLKGERAGENFIAITDPNTLLERMAREANFRHTFLNPSDIGGRYSALSLFGVVPAALIGLDVREFLSRSMRAMEACGPTVPIGENEAARLGCLIGALARDGRDKLTILTDEPISSLGLWIEQLVAESTGKEGVGVIPVVGEPLGPPEVYANDRVFVFVHTQEIEARTSEALTALERAGHPVVRRALTGPLDLGAEFFVWELATAVAGAVLNINPFDQPNVQESKDNTNQLLTKFVETGALPAPLPTLTDGALVIYGPDVSGANSAKDGASSAAALLAEFFDQTKPGDYVALLAYLQETPQIDQLLEALRTILRDRLRVATTVGYGPRYLHSTGQLHKGGPDSGIFMVLTDDDQAAVPIPGEPYDFGVLKSAQALGDFSSLVSHDRRALRVHLGSDVRKGLEALRAIFESLAA